MQRQHLLEVLLRIERWKMNLPKLSCRGDMLLFKGSSRGGDKQKDLQPPLLHRMNIIYYFITTLQLWLSNSIQFKKELICDIILTSALFNETIRLHKTTIENMVWKYVLLQEPTQKSSPALIWGCQDSLYFLCDGNIARVPGVIASIRVHFSPLAQGWIGSITRCQTPRVLCCFTVYLNVSLVHLLDWPSST